MPLNEEYDPEINAAKPKVLTTEEILKERGSNYGAFKTQALITQLLEREFYAHMYRHNPKGYTVIMEQNVIREGLHQIFSKLGRAANGDPLYADNFVDIAGYAELVANDLRF